MPKPSIIPFLLITLASTAAAGHMSGGPYDVPITMVGAAGNGTVAAPAGTGISVMRAVGFISSGTILGASDGTLVLPGLFGGAPGMIPYSSPYTDNFGVSTATASLFIAAYSLNKDYMVFVSSSPEDAPLRVSPLAISIADRNLVKSGAVYTHPLADAVWEVSFMQDDGSLLAPRQGINGVLTLPYDDANNDGVVDGTQPPVRTSTLSIWWLDEDHGMWVRLPDSRVNLSSHTVTSPVTYASVFALMGSPDIAVGEVRAVPSPWRPNGPHAGNGSGQTGTLAGGITFWNMPSVATIRIYTLSGALVKEIHHDDGTYQHIWDGKNQSGQDVVTGVYIFTVQTEGGRKSGKLAIVR
jgi:hypothetical protein